MLTKEEMQSLADRERPRIRRIDSVKTITVIAAETLVGEGVMADPARRAMRYYSLGGELLAVNDPCVE